MEPIGDERADYRISYLASLITNLAIRTHGKQGAKLTAVKEFLFKWDAAENVKPQQNIEQMKQVFLSLAAGNKGDKKRGSSRPPKRNTRRKSKK